jgi:hypothetical protein
MQVGKTRASLRQLLPAAALGPGALETVRIRFNIDQPGIDPAEFIGPKAATGKRSPAKALHENITFAHKLEYSRAVHLGPQIHVGILLAE